MCPIVSSGTKLSVEPSKLPSYENSLLKKICDPNKDNLYVNGDTGLPVEVRDYKANIHYKLHKILYRRLYRIVVFYVQVNHVQ